MNIKKSVGIFTLGCRVNQYESCAIAEGLKQNGFDVSKSKNCDYYIINTCAVTSESERKSRQLVRRCAKKGKAVVIGCASQLNPSEFLSENVIYIGGNRNKMDAVNAILNDGFGEINAVADMNGATYEEMHITEKDNLFSECRAFIKIQDGCNGKCSYCIIPKCRGKVRSRDAEDIVEEAQILVKRGYSEIILTGIEVGAYNKKPLSQLICDVGSVDGLKRLRLGSLSPNVASDKFLEAVSSCDCFMPHIHLSLQSCSDNVLKPMMRPYRQKDIISRVRAIRKYIPNCNISADIIVGFPGETEMDFKETVRILNELEIFHVHSFPYSERVGTPAATMENSIPKSVRFERNSELIAANAEKRKSILDKKISATSTVLVEKIVDGDCFGHTDDFFEARFKSDNNSVGDYVDVKIISHDGTVLFVTQSEDNQ